MTMVDGTSVSIENLAVDMLMATAPTSNFQYLSTFNMMNFAKTAINKVTVSDAPNEMYKLSSVNGYAVTTTANHLVFTKNRGAVETSKLNNSDILMTIKGFSYVDSVSKVQNTSSKVFNFVTGGQNTLFANGILVYGTN